jgi:hypothetical protein
LSGGLELCLEIGHTLLRVLFSRAPSLNCITSDWGAGEAWRGLPLQTSPNCQADSGLFKTCLKHKSGPANLV